ncbi:hypothetical protein D3C76_1814820 [compost metagenome]
MVCSVLAGAAGSDLIPVSADSAGEVQPCSKAEARNKSKKGCSKENRFINPPRCINLDSLFIITNEW